ncbi:MAG TPA: hypothetical protein DDW90_09095 [Cyanobacteria bacterium UBA9971]|nr:hypothetical protein [Cyanobacteria bacterium UBA9971]
MNGLIGFKPVFFANFKTNTNSSLQKEFNNSSLLNNPISDTVSFGKSKRNYSDATKLLMRTMRKLAESLNLPDFYTGKRFGLNHKEKVSIEHLLPHSQRSQAVSKGLRSVNSLENFVPVGNKTNSDRGSIPLKKWYKAHPDYLKNGIEALKEYEKVSNPIINGKEWVKSLKRLLNQELGYVAFAGRKNTNGLNMVQKDQRLSLVA